MTFAYASNSFGSSQFGTTHKLCKCFPCVENHKANTENQCNQIDDAQCSLIATRKYEIEIYKTPLMSVICYI